MKIFLSLLLIFSFSINTASADEDNLLVINAWIAEAPPVSKVMVAYMIIKNNSNETINIIHASSESFSSIEFHETRYENDIAKMMRHENLSIPAKDSIELKRGAQHLMLFNPVRRLLAGDTVKISFTTNHNKIKTASITVKKATL